MEFQEILAEGPIKIERLATKPADSADNEGRIIYVRDEEKIYYGTATVWYEISSGASSSLAAHMADTTTHGSVGDIAGDTDVTNAITAHSVSPSAHPLSTLANPGFLKNLANDTELFLNSYGDWTKAISETTTRTAYQVSHGFVVGDVVRLNGGVYVKAIATSAENAEVIGIVTEVVTSIIFKITLIGYVTGLSGLTAGSLYFLSDTTAGVLSLIEPSTSGYVSKPLLISTSTTEGYFFNWRGSLISTSTTTPGIAVENQPLVLGEYKNVDTLVIAQNGLKIGSGAGTAVTSTADEINKLHSATLDIASVTANATKVNYLTEAFSERIGGTVNGYARLPLNNGLILQWGQYYLSTQDDTVYRITFPITFPNMCLSTQCTIHNLNPGQDVWMGVYNVTSSYADYLCNSDGDGTGDAGFHWFAIGY